MNYINYDVCQTYREPDIMSHSFCSKNDGFFNEIQDQQWKNEKKRLRRFKCRTFFIEPDTPVISASYFRREFILEILKEKIIMTTLKWDLYWSKFISGTGGWELMRAWMFANAERVYNIIGSFKGLS